MKGIISTLLLALAWSGILTADPASDSRFDPVFAPPTPSASVRVLSVTQVQALFTLAAKSHWNVFDLLDEAGLYLKPRGIRVEVSGTDLRKMSVPFIIGDTRVDTLLPLLLVESFSVGARLGGDADVEIKLTRPTSGFLELGDFALETRYGFRDIGDKVLDGAFGITVKNGLFTWNLKKIARVPDPTGRNNPNFIAIHLDNFFRPKRWEIDPVRVRPGQTPTP